MQCSILLVALATLAIAKDFFDVVPNNVVEMKTVGNPIPPLSSAGVPILSSSSTLLSLSSSPSSMKPSKSISNRPRATTTMSSYSVKAPSTISPPARFASLTATPNPTAPATALERGAANPPCLKVVEISCLNLATNCIDTVNSDTVGHIWSIASCVAATTCYGVGDLISSINCQTGFSATNAGEASLDYNNVYASIVGSCAYAANGCPITQQTFIDFYYGTLSAINTANYPSSRSVVIGFWQTVLTWAATGSTLPYLNFNDWLHFSSYPPTSAPTSGPATTTTYIHWNPNPAPPPGATSQTFVSSTKTTIIAIPTSTTTITVGGATITLESGGTPIGGPVPTGVSQPGAVTPTWDNNPIPPSGAKTVTFTAPSWISVVPVPTDSNSPPQNVTGPPGDKNSNGEDWWLLLFLGLIRGPMPPDVGIPGGSIPIPAPPPVWTGPWSDPHPTSTSTTTSDEPEPTSSSTTTSHEPGPTQSSTTTSDEPEPTSTSTTTSDEPGPTCPVSVPNVAYNWATDPENADWDDEGTDPDMRKRDDLNATSVLFRRAGPRHIKVPACGLTQTSPGAVNLGGGTYLSVGDDFPPSTNIALSISNVPSRPHAGSATTAQEHVFELGYVNQYFTSRETTLGCAWVTSVWNGNVNGGTFASQVLATIDNQANMVWVDVPMNQAKSNVVNMNKNTAGNPPQSENVNSIGNIDQNNPLIYQAEYFARNIAAVGQYFGATAGIFQTTANTMQRLLAGVTPATPITPPLPNDFNNWLRGVVMGYPNGCTSRASNFYTYYRNRLNVLSAQTQTQVPQCFALYHQMMINPSAFNAADLLPPAPTLPPCDTAGTPGRVQIGLDSVGNPVLVHGNARVLGSGRLDYPALGSGQSLADPHYIIRALDAVDSSCTGAYYVGFGTAGNGFEDAGIALQCGGQSGSRTAPFSFVSDTTVLPNCVLYNHNDGSNTYHLICSTSQGIASSCVDFYALSLGGTYPRASISLATLAFIPS